jgi:hypothetical protein
MTYTFKLARRLAVSRHLAMLSLLLLLAACSGDSTAPDTKTSSSPGDFASLQVSPQSVTIEASQRVRFRGQIQDANGGLVATHVAWEATGGTIDSTGTFWSSDPGTYRVIARRRWDGSVSADHPSHASRKDIDNWRDGRRQPGSADTSIVQVVPVASKLQRLLISPKPITIEVGAKHSFNVTGYLKNNSTVPVGVNWSATGGDIDPSGAYTAGTTSGHFWVVASNTTGTISDTAGFTIALSGSSSGPNRRQQLKSIVLTPAQNTLLAGASLQYQVYGRTKSGDSVTVAVAFSATGGTVTSSGLFTAGSKAGTFKVIARDTATSLADTAQLTVTAPSITEPSGDVTTNGLTVGSWLYPVDSLGKQYTASVINAYGPTLISQLSVARQKGGMVALYLSRARSRVNGTLSVSTATAEIQSWPDISPYLSTIVCVMVGDDIASSVIWGPGAPYLAQWDSIARVVRVRWPTARPCLRALPTQMKGRAWQWMTHAWPQYHAKKHGPVATWRDSQRSTASSLGLGVIFGLNVLSGGDGSSGIHGTAIDGSDWQMTGTEVAKYGTALLPYTCGLLNWQYGPSWNYSGRTAAQTTGIQSFDSRSDVKAAIDSLKRYAAHLPARAC